MQRTELFCRSLFSLESLEGYGFSIGTLKLPFETEQGVSPGRHDRFFLQPALTQERMYGFRKSTLWNCIGPG